MRELPARPVVGVLHPGLMGASIGSALKARSGVVIWADAGRTHATAKRAELADLVAVPDIAALTRRADVIISICPPHAAHDVARHVAEQVVDVPVGDRPLFVEANAVAPDTVTDIATSWGPANVVDAAVIGPPAWERGTTVLWLAGERAAEVAALFADGPFDARVLGPRLGAASALKACFALQSKAMRAAWLALAAAAREFGVSEEVRGELARGGVDLDAQIGGTSPARVAWRWAGEMDEAAATFAAAGLPDGFSRAAAEVYRRIAAADEAGRRDVWGLPD